MVLVAAWLRCAVALKNDLSDSGDRRRYTFKSMTSDLDLLRRFARENAQDAFAEIVRRHLNLVYSAALRQVRSPQLAEDIAQSVFADLARRGTGILPVNETNSLAPWLYAVARRTAIDAIRKESRRQLRERIAVEMNNMNATANDWTQIAPLLDDAMAALDETDRSAVLLRYFENKSLREVGEALGASEDAAQKRVSRAVEHLREFFSKRNVTIGVSGLAVLISANAVQAAPAALAKVVAAVAIVKGAAAGGSTLALAKGALKIMAWTKVNTAIVAGVAVLLAAGTIVTVKETEAHQGYQWQVQADDLSTVLEKAPPMVRILPTKFSKPPKSFQSGVEMPIDVNGGINIKRIGFNTSVADMIFDAYDFNFGSSRVILPQLPQERYDFIVSLPNGSSEALAQEIKRKFGFVAKRETIETNVLFLMVTRPNAQGLKPSADNSDRSGHSGDFGQNGFGFGEGRYSFHNVTLSDFARYCEGQWRMPVIDRTGVTNRFDIDFSWRSKRNGSEKAALKQAMLDQLGLEFVHTNAPVEILVVERANP
jgi:uncharacterized protein (TIGR03435 family)